MFLRVGSVGHSFYRKLIGAHAALTACLHTSTVHAMQLLHTACDIHTHPLVHTHMLHTEWMVVKKVLRNLIRVKPIFCISSPETLVF